MKENNASWEPWKRLDLNILPNENIDTSKQLAQKAVEGILAAAKLAALYSDKV